MRAFWNTVKGYAAGVFALLVCPCHLPLTFPLILSLTAGTALGGWLAGKFGLLFGIFTALFLAGLFLAWRWLVDEGDGEPCPVPPRSGD